MKVSPILMSAPMVRGCLLEARSRGSGKTQTRRTMKPQPQHLQVHDYRGRRVYDGEQRMWCWNSLVLENIWDFPNGEDRKALAAHCPYGQIGDLLYVRETWASVGSFDPGLDVYRADYPECVPAQFENIPAASEIRWTPGIHQPRRASRLTLRITDVRVERLQEITKADAIAEGVETDNYFERQDYFDAVAPPGSYGRPTPVGEYAVLWESINGYGTWDDNPWVWALTFEVFAENVDAYIERTDYALAA